MFVFTKFTQLLLALSCVNVTLGFPPLPESVCLSRFDYDAKLLERLIHLENKMKQLEEKSLADSETLKDESRALVDNVNALTSELQMSQTAAFVEMKEQAQQLEADVQAKLVEIEKTQTQQTTDQKAFVSGVTTSLEAVQSRVNSSLAKFSADAQKPATAFYVRYTGTENPGKNTLLKLGTAVMNPDGLYDTGTGYFVAKTTGLYLFSVQFCTNPGKGTNLRIYINDDFISEAMTYSGSSSGTYPCSTSTVVAKVAVGDKISVRTGPVTSTSGYVLLCDSSRWCSFMGVLIQ